VLLGVLLLSTPVTADVSRFDRTVEALQRADTPLRADFASIALIELTEIYLAEADLARNEAQAVDGDPTLRSWSRSVEQFAEQLLLVQQDVEFGLPVELRRHYREVPAVSVAGRTVMLAHPRRAQQAAFEQRVLAQFCTVAPCDRLTGGQVRTQPIPVAPPLVTPTWAFSPAGPRCRYKGLAVQFGTAGNLAEQRARCDALMQEAEALAAELAWQSRHDVEVDWPALSVSATAHRPEHLVQVNDAGDSLLISVPLIHATPGLLAAVTPWLQRRHADGEPASVQLDAHALGWD
jgi:hypothetical protein